MKYAPRSKIEDHSLDKLALEIVANLCTDRQASARSLTGSPDLLRLRRD